MPSDSQLEILPGGLPTPPTDPTYEPLAVCTDATHDLRITNRMRPVKVSFGPHCRMISLPKRRRMATWTVSNDKIENLKVTTRRDRIDWIDLEFDAVGVGPVTITALSTTGQPVGVIYLEVEKSS